MKLSLKNLLFLSGVFLSSNLLAALNAMAQTDGVYSPEADERAREFSGYVYVDCASADFSPPLVFCTPLHISKDLDSISAIRVNEPYFPNESTPDFFVLASNRVPIAIPKIDYEAQKKWTFQGRSYLKVRQGVPVLSTGLTADLIAVVGNSSQIKSLEFSSLLTREVQANIVLTLLYSPARGVEAIGFPGGRGEGGLYYCVKKPCLFAAGL